MASQQEAIDFIKSNYAFNELQGGMLNFVFDLEAGRSQMVFVLVDDTKIEYFSPFGDVSDVTAKQALDAISSYSFGMQIIDDEFVVKHVVFLENLDASEIKDGFHIVASIADELEKKLVGGDNY